MFAARQPTGQPTQRQQLQRVARRAVAPLKVDDEDGVCNPGSPRCLLLAAVLLVVLPSVAVLMVPFIDATALKSGHAGVLAALHSVTPRGRRSSSSGSILREGDGGSVPAGTMATSEHGERAVRLYAFGDDYTSGSGRLHDCSSYRYHLWVRLQTWRREKQVASQASPHIVFVGSQLDTGEGDPLVKAFDTHHEGHPGWTTRDADQWLLKNVDTAPRAAIEHDIALVTLGVHDLVSNPEEPPRDIAARVRAAAEHLRRREPGGPGASAVLLATVPPLQATGDAIDRVPVMAVRKVKALNDAFVATCARVAAEREPGQRPWLTCVDMWSGIDANTATLDGLRPADALERAMAQRFFVALKPLLEDVRVGVEAYEVMLDRKRAATKADGQAQRHNSKKGLGGKKAKFARKDALKRKRDGKEALSVEEAQTKAFFETFAESQKYKEEADREASRDADSAVPRFFHPVWRSKDGVSADDPAAGDDAAPADPFAYMRYDDVKGIRMKAEMQEMASPPPPSPPPPTPWVTQLLSGRTADKLDASLGLRQVRRPEDAEPTAVVVRPGRSEDGSMTLDSSDAHILSSLPQARPPPEPETAEERMMREARESKALRKDYLHAHAHAHASRSGAESASLAAASVARAEAAHRVPAWR